MWNKVNAKWSESNKRLKLFHAVVLKRKNNATLPRKFIKQNCTENDTNEQIETDPLEASKLQTTEDHE